MKDKLFGWFIDWLFPDHHKIEDTLYFQAKKTYVARMRFANEFEKLTSPFFTAIADKFTYFLEGFKK